VLENRVCELSM